jgi:hypothetical protein
MVGGVRAAIFAATAAIMLGVCGTLEFKLAHARNDLLTLQLANSVALAQAQAVAHDTEQRINAAAATAATQYEKGKHDAQVVADAVVVGLRNDTIRLRREWAGCETGNLAQASATAVGPDAATSISRSSPPGVSASGA